MGKASRIIMALFYVAAGLNHFWHPEFYLPLIPDYLPWPKVLNFLSGLGEIVFGLGLFFPQTRKAATWGIICLLIAFIPAHVYFIEIGSCVAHSLCVPPWVSWLRLILIHPLLMAWAYWVGKTIQP